MAKGTSDPVYKAHVFYTKSDQRAVKFYQTTSLAFQIGYQLFEKFSASGHTKSADEEEAMVGSNEVVAEIKESTNVDLLTRCESLKEVDIHDDMFRSNSLQERNETKVNNR
ncbi:hypothetical protein, partial [Salmonella sp. s54925]|uniref:hypothetical protein n=1 Tax=Salmonella sp. s54925 TaxID=3159674 RepID=UPI0039808834